MKAMEEHGGDARTRQLARWGPMVVLLVVAGLVAALIATNDPDGEEVAGAAGSTASSVPPDEVQLPPNVLPFSGAEARGEVDDIDWVDRGAAGEGVPGMALGPPPGCFAPCTGRGGGDAGVPPVRNRHRTAGPGRHGRGKHRACTDDDRQHSSQHCPHRGPPGHDRRRCAG